MSNTKNLNKQLKKVAHFRFASQKVDRKGEGGGHGEQEITDRRGWHGEQEITDRRGGSMGSKRLQSGRGVWKARDYRQEGGRQRDQEITVRKGESMESKRLQTGRGGAWGARDYRVREGDGKNK